MDLYDVLGVHSSATEQDIKHAYRKLIKQYHPDKNPSNSDAQRHSCEINHAYQILGSDASRRQYDMQQRLFAPDMIAVDDILTQLFACPSASVFMTTIHVPFVPPVAKPLPIFAVLHITLSEMYFGAVKSVSVNRWRVCKWSHQRKYETVAHTVHVGRGINDGEWICVRNGGNYMGDDCVGDIKIQVKLDNAASEEFTRSGLDLIYTTEINTASRPLKIMMCHPSGEKYALVHREPIPVATKLLNTCVVGLGFIRDDVVGNLIIKIKLT